MDHELTRARANTHPGTKNVSEDVTELEDGDVEDTNTVDVLEGRLQWPVMLGYKGGASHGLFAVILLYLTDPVEPGMSTNTSVTIRKKKRISYGSLP